MQGEQIAAHLGGMCNGTEGQACELWLASQLLQGHGMQLTDRMYQPVRKSHVCIPGVTTQVCCQQQNLGIHSNSLESKRIKSIRFKIWNCVVPLSDVMQLRQQQR